MARPTRTDSRQRRARFLCLLADGLDVVDARKQARLDPDAALRVVAEADFRELVQLLKAGSIPPVAPAGTTSGGSGYTLTHQRRAA